MKYLLLLVFCLGVDCEFITTGLTTTPGSKLNKKIVGPIDEKRSKKYKRISRLAKKYNIALKNNEEDVTNEANIVRPCDFEDLDCIREFFANNSCCKPAYGPVPDPVYISQNTVFFPYTNMSLTFTDLTVSGLSKSEIVELYLNEKTKSVVLAIEVPYLDESSPLTYFTYQRPARESIVLADESRIVFKKVILTAVFRIPMYLDLAEIRPYIPDAAPSYYNGPNSYNSSDPQVVAAYASLLDSSQILYPEELVFQAQLFQALYIQSNICDFGVNLYSV